MKKNTILIIILTLFLIIGCSNRFARRENIDSFTFGLAINRDYCEQNEGGKHYKNGVYEGRICAHYRSYKCRIEHICNGDKQCEKEAEGYWINHNWVNFKGEKLNDTDRVKATIDFCESQRLRCDYSPFEKKCYQSLLDMPIEKINTEDKNIFIFLRKKSSNFKNEFKKYCFEHQEEANKNIYYDCKDFTN